MGWFKKLTGGIFEPISHALAGVDDTIRENIPGGWTIPALIAGGYYFAPEIGAFVNGSTGATVAAGEVAGGEAAINSALTSGGLTGTNALASGEALTATPTNYMGGLSGVGADTASAAFPLTSGLGLSTGAEATGLSQYLNPSYLTPAAIAGSSLLGAVTSSQAAKAQADAAAQQGALNYKIWQEANQLNAPFRSAGLASQNRLMTLLGIKSGTTGTAAGDFVTDPNSPDFGKYARDFSMADFQADPGYAFRLSEGMKALDRTAAARGGLLSGSTLKGAERYGQDMASQEFQNAYNRYQTNRANQINPLMGYATGPGLSATGATTAAANQYGANQNEAIANMANARQSGYVGPANAIASGVNSYLNYAGNSALTNALMANRGIA